MKINYIFLIDEIFGLDCEFFKPLELWNGLKKKIFSLKKTTMALSSAQQNILTTKEVTKITNYDSVEIKNITFILYDGFILENTNNKIDITLKKVILIQNSFKDETII